MFSFVRNCHTVFQSECTILPSHQQWMRVRIALHSHQHLVLPVFWILAIQTNVCSGISLLFLFEFSNAVWCRRKWQPTPVFLAGESQGRGSLVGCCLRGHTESDITEVTSHCIMLYDVENLFHMLIFCLYVFFGKAFLFSNLFSNLLPILKLGCLFYYCWILSILCTFKVPVL